jgi:hypothetical protein
MSNYIPLVKPKGRPSKYTPDKLWAEFERYVKWSEENPVKVGVTYQRKKEGKNKEVEAQKRMEDKPRLLSVNGFLLFIGLSDSWWGSLNGEFLGVKSTIKTYCETGQIEYAAMGIFNANIISRLLGLADRAKVEHSGNVDTGLKIIVQDEETAELVRKLKTK